jgi:hypothetical protein
MWVCTWADTITVPRREESKKTWRFLGCSHVQATFAAARLQNGRPEPGPAGQLCQHGLHQMGHVARFLGRSHVRATFAAARLQNGHLGLGPRDDCVNLGCTWWATSPLRPRLGYDTLASCIQYPESFFYFLLSKLRSLSQKKNLNWDLILKKIYSLRFKL